MNSNTVPPGDLRAAFLSAMRNLDATVTIITTREDDSRHGMAATAVSSLTVDPPALLACVNRAASLHGPVTRVKWFCVNLLARQHDALFQDFIARASADRLSVGIWHNGLHGLPYLEGASASLFCSVEQHVDYGTHTIFIGRVESVHAASTGSPLVYQDGKAGRFEPGPASNAAGLKVGHIIYRTNNMERALAFYRDSLGLRVKLRDGDAWATLDLAGATLALEHDSSDQTPRTTQLTLKLSEDLATFIERLKASGVAVGEIMQGAHERTVVLTDPDSNRTIVYAPL